MIDKKPSSGTNPGADRHASAYPLLLLMVLIWGSNWPIMKIGVRSMTPLQFTSVRILLGTVCMFALLAVLGRLSLPARRDLPVVFSVGLIQVALFLTLAATALVYVEAGRSAILSYTMPLWVAPLSVLVLGEPLSRIKLAGLAAGVAGIAVMFNPLGFDWSNGDTLFGNGILLFAALCWAGVIVHVRSHNWTGTPLELLPWQLLVGSIPVALLALWLDGSTPVQWSETLWVILAFNGAIATALAYWLAVTVNRTLPAVTASLGFLGVPVTGVLASMLILDEPITATKGLGLGLIVGGIALAALADRRPAGG